MVSSLTDKIIKINKPMVNTGRSYHELPVCSKYRINTGISIPSGSITVRKIELKLNNNNNINYGAYNCIIKTTDGRVYDSFLTLLFIF